MTVLAPRPGPTAAVSTGVLADRGLYRIWCRVDSNLGNFRDGFTDRRRPGGLTRTNGARSCNRRGVFEVWHDASATGHPAVIAVADTRLVQGRLQYVADVSAASSFAVPTAIHDGSP
jgi:hypothetical protein